MIINTVMQGATVSGSVTPTGNPLPSKTWIPTTEDQIIEANSYTTGKQTIKGDPALIAGNIREGATIFNVPGTFTHVIESSVPSASDIRKGKQAYVNGNAIDGSLESRNLVTIDGSRILGEAGIYPSIDQYIPSASINFNNAISISGNAVTANINASGSVIVTINGSVQSNYNVSQGGYVPSGSVIGTTTFSGGRTFSLPTVGGSTWIPTTVDQTIEAKKYILGQQIIKGDTNLRAENIKSGVSIFGINGKAFDESIDWVVAQGSSGTHVFSQESKYVAWRAWNSGKLEFWYSNWWAAFTGSNDQTYSYGTTKYISMSDIYNGNTDYVFQGVPYVDIQIRANTSALLNAQITGISTSQISVYVSRYANKAVPKSYYDLYATGRWK